MRRWSIFFIMLSACFAIFETTGSAITPYAGIIGWAGGLTSIVVAIVLMMFSFRR
jgi:hypothetical protein